MLNVLNCFDDEDDDDCEDYSSDDPFPVKKYDGEHEYDGAPCCEEYDVCE